MVKLTLPSFDGLPDDIVEKLDAYEEVSTEVKNKLVSLTDEFEEGRNEVIDKALSKTKEVIGKAKDGFGRAQEGIDAVKGGVDKAKAGFSKVQDGIGKARDGIEKVKGGITNLKNSVEGTVNEVKAKVNGVFEGLESGRDLVEIKDRIKGALNGDRSAIELLGKDAEKLFSTKVLGLDESTGLISRSSEIFGKIEVVKDSASYYFGKGSPKNVSNVLGFIRDLGGSEFIDMVDMGAEAALTISVIDEIQSWRIPDLLNDVFKAKPNDSGGYDYGYSDEFRFELGRGVSESLQNNGDLSFIHKLITHAGDKSLLSSNPDFPVQFISSYAFPQGTIPGEHIEGKTTYASELALFIEVMDSLKKDWFYIDRNGEQVWNLYFIGAASEDVITLLKYSDLHREAILAAPNYRMDSFIYTARSLYPMIALG